MVTSLNSGEDRLIVDTNQGQYSAKAVVCATGSWQKSFIPNYQGQAIFEGIQIHSAHYQSPDRFAGKHVLVVGGGNSGAQIMAEVSLVADATWVTLAELQFLPDDVDGRILFDVASEKYRALTSGGNFPSPKPRDLLGRIVMVEPVKEARDRGRLQSSRPFERFTENGVIWSDGREEAIDAVIWCTGFRPALDFLKPLGVVRENGKVEVNGTHSVKEARLWLVGYGNWTGFASATPYRGRSLSPGDSPGDHGYDKEIPSLFRIIKGKQIIFNEFFR